MTVRHLSGRPTSRDDRSSRPHDSERLRAPQAARPPRGQLQRPRPLVTEAKRLSPEARGGLEILVLSEHEGQPVVDAIVSVGPLARSEERERLVTDDRGRVLPVVAPGEYQVVVQADGYLTRNLRLGIPPTGAPVRREVRLPRVVPVDGIVLDQNGLGVEGASVNFSAGRQQGRSNTDSKHDDRRRRCFFG